MCWREGRRGGGLGWTATKLGSYSSQIIHKTKSLLESKATCSQCRSREFENSSKFTAPIPARVQQAITSLSWATLASSKVLVYWSRYYFRLLISILYLYLSWIFSVFNVKKKKSVQPNLIVCRVSKTHIITWLVNLLTKFVEGFVQTCVSLGRPWYHKSNLLLLLFLSCKQNFTSREI